MRTRRRRASRLHYLALGVALALTGCQLRQVEQSCRNLKEVERAELWERGWMPRGLLPSSASDIHVRYDLVSSEECGRFAFRSNELAAMQRLLQPAGRRPHHAFRCPGDASWWPGEVALQADKALTFYVLPAKQGLPPIQVAVNNRTSQAFFWRGGQ